MTQPRFARSLLTTSIAIALAACGPQNSGTGDDVDAAGGGCTEGATQCSGNTFQTCSDDAWDVTAQCPVLCDSDRGCLACQPDTRFCSGEDVMQCSAAGDGSSVVETCAGGAHCLGGYCADLCEDAAENRSYLGCEYFAVDLDNAVEVLGAAQPPFGCVLVSPDAVVVNIKHCVGDSGTAGLCDPGDVCPTGFTCTQADACALDASHSPFAVVVSNPQSFPVGVTMTTATGAPQTVQVQAGQVATLFPQQLSFPDASVDRTMQGKLAYKIVADAPIVAYQFNPLNNVAVFSNDASLLIPTTTWDVDYYAMTWATLTRRNAAASTNDYNGYVTVVAGQDGTAIEVTPSAGVRGNPLAVPPIPAIAAGVPTRFDLDAYDVLNLEAVADGDLTGTRIQAVGDSPRPFGVFAGHEAMVNAQASPPNPQLTSGPCCADHIEEMMFPTSTWGKTFAVARSQPRNGEPDDLRIMAQTAGTTVTFTPAPISGSCGTLAPGQFCQVKIMADTKIEASQPVLIARYLESVIWSGGLLGGSEGNGDPSMAIVVPAEQFREDYTILVPAQYDQSYLSIATLMNGTVHVDGTDVSAQLAMFGGTHKAGRIMVAAGQHTIACSAGCGIEVMGYSDAVSYLFAGGLDLRQIVVD